MGLKKRQFQSITQTMLSNIDQVKKLVNSSFLDEKTKRNYLQAYQTRLKKLQKLGLQGIL